MVFRGEVKNYRKMKRVCLGVSGGRGEQDNKGEKGNYYYYIILPDTEGEKEGQSFKKIKFH